MYNPDAPFGLEPLGLELGAERLMAERKCRGHVLKGEYASDFTAQVASWRTGIP